MGSVLCAGIGGANSTVAETDQQILAGDETYVRVKAAGSTFYRAIDSVAATIDFFPSVFRSADAAKALLAKALADPSPSPSGSIRTVQRQPEHQFCGWHTLSQGVINTDKAKCYPPAINAPGILPPDLVLRSTNTLTY